MNNLICSITCTWNVGGKVKPTVTLGSFGDVTKDNLQLLSPSIPMLVSHQLGTFLPTTGLSLTSHLINFVVNGQHLVSPINSVLKETRLDFVTRSQGGVAIQFKPETGRFAKNENVEDGSKQFVYNYVVSVFNNLPNYNLIICKIFLGLSLQAYLDFLDKQIELGKLSPSKLNWNSDFSVNMTKVSIEASVSYKTGTPEDYNEESEINTLEFYSKLLERHKAICRKLELD